MSEAEYAAALPIADVEPGRMRACIVAGRDIVLCHTREGVFALDNICTHAHAQLAEGRLRGMRVICPLHGASYDVRDGRVLGAPAVKPLHVHKVRVTDGVIEVAVAIALPPQAM